MTNPSRQVQRAIARKSAKIAAYPQGFNLGPHRFVPPRKRLPRSRILAGRVYHFTKGYRRDA